MLPLGVVVTNHTHDVWLDESLEDLEGLDTTGMILLFGM